MPEIYRHFYRRLSRALLACDPIPIQCRYCEDEAELHGATQQDIDNLWRIDSLPSLKTTDSVRESALVLTNHLWIRFEGTPRNPEENHAELETIPLLRCFACKQVGMRIPPSFWSEAVQRQIERDQVEARRLLHESGYPVEDFLLPGAMSRWSPEDPSPYFSDENDHNPFVIPICPECRGFGYKQSLGKMDTCPLCLGLGILPEAQPLFEDADRSVHITYIEQDGRVTCPKCGIRFSLETKKLWSGKRHLTMCCGARLLLLPRPDDLHDYPLPVPRKSAWE